MNLKITSQTQGADVHLALQGILDETSPLPEFNTEIAGRLIIDLSHLTLINSLGCQRWLKWITRSRVRGGIALIRCSSAFIGQVNVLQGFIPVGVKIESFQVPYHCDACGFEDQLTFTVGKDQKVPTERTCAKCGGESELDVVEAKYFNFLPKSA